MSTLGQEINSFQVMFLNNTYSLIPYSLFYLFKKSLIVLTYNMDKFSLLDSSGGLNSICVNISTFSTLLLQSTLSETGILN